MTPENPDDIVGHKTFRGDSPLTFRHEPLTRAEAEQMLAEIDAETEARAKAMPDEQSAIEAMFSAWLRLKELGWGEAIYCPKDGSTFEVIEPGSTGIHDCHYEGEWPKGTYWVHDPQGDLYPSRPVLFRQRLKDT